jgi:Cellulase (glycosyl hydrolase family 5)
LDSNTWIGANFWSRAGGPRMWQRYDAAVVREELATLAEHGCDVTRSFCFWPDFVPEPGVLDEDAAAHFADFLDASAEAGLGTIPTFLVGHMSGENWDPAWRRGRDLYRDLGLVAEEAWFAAEIVRRFGAHPAVVGWLVSNEMPLYGGPATSDEITAWARILVQAVRSGGATQPVSLGDGAWGVEAGGEDNGFSLRALAPLVDFVGPHVYPMQDDPVRQSLAAAFACELAGGFGRPVVLEEFGASSDFGSDEHIAGYYRQVLATTLLAGARGWLAWCNADFDDLAGEDPYRHHPFELHFGLTDRHGAPKRQLEALAEFAGLVRGLEPDGWERIAGEVAIVVPEHLEGSIPFTAPAYRTDLRDDLFQAYVAAREADLPVALVRERDGIPASARLYLAPCAKLLTAPGVEQLAELARGGATVYLSFFAGSTTNQRGPWLPWLDELFGVRHELHYGLVDLVDEDDVSFELVAPLGSLPPGARLSFRVPRDEGARAYLPVAPDGADVVAVDGHGRPALLRHGLGAGAAYLCTYPLEHMAARTPRVNPEDTWRLYSALADASGVVRPVRVEDPRILAGRLRTGGGERVLLVNCSLETVDVEPIVQPGHELPAPSSLTLEPSGVAMLGAASPATVGEGSDARV